MATKHSRLIDKLRRGLKERIELEREVRNRREGDVNDADRPTPFGAEDVIRMRTGLKMGIPAFAMMLELPTETVLGWEDGTRRPTPSAARLLHYVEKCEILTIPRARKNMDVAKSK